MNSYNSKHNNEGNNSSNRRYEGRQNGQNDNDRRNGGYQRDRNQNKSSYNDTWKNNGSNSFSRNSNYENNYNQGRSSNRGNERDNRESEDQSKHSRSDQEPVKKDFYIEHSDVKERSDEDNQKFLDENEIQVKGNNVPRPVTTFDESNLPKYLIEQLKNQPKFVKPSVIQAQAWPIALQGRDMIGIAQTGSGKTLSFILPGIVHVMAQKTLKRGDGPVILVMAPTRELAMQIEQEARKFANVCQISTLAIYGGVPKYDQYSKLREGVEILIATPGRLLDFLKNRDTNLKRVSYLVFDEADRMLDMGFEKDIKAICSYMSIPDRQTLMFSATWPKEVQSLAGEYCSMAPVFCQIGKQEGGMSTNANITQNVKVLDNNYQKYEELCQLLSKVTKENTEHHKIIIFCTTKAGVSQLERSINRDNQLRQQIRYEAQGIHGDKLQQERDMIYKRFKVPISDSYVIQGQLGKVYRSNILIATDVASRGLDVKDISIVINFDMPKNIDDYVHRIGRTGRAGAKGQSFSFITKGELSLASDLVKFMQQANLEISPELMEMKRQAYGVKAENKFKRYRRQEERGAFRNFDSRQVKSQALDFGGNPSRGPQQNGGSKYNFNRDNDESFKKRDQKYQEKFTQNDLRGELFGSFK